MKKKSRKKKGLKIFLVFLLVLFVGAIAGGGVYLLTMRQSGSFFSKSKVNGYEISGMEPQEAASMLEETFDRTAVVINEKGKPASEGSLTDFGYKVDKESLGTALEQAMEDQRKDLGSLFNSLSSGSVFEVEIPFSVDEGALSSSASVSRLAEERYPSRDAYLDYDAEANEYRIVPEVYGNEFPEEKLRALVQARINEYTTQQKAEEKVTVDIPEDFYTPPAVTAQDADLQLQCSVYNSFCKAEIVYTFGSQTETLGWDRIQNWIVFSDGAGNLNEGDIRQFVVDMENKYNTRYIDRVFHTTYGNDVVIPAGLNEYGYRINEDAEVQQLINDIYANTRTEREPVYYSTSSDYGNPLYYHREGVDDLAGTYVEVNLSAQHLWFYKNGSLVVESDIVSGSVAKGAQTQTGAFPLAYKESPSTLVGSNAADGYRTEVQYWMPFYEGQGLHDATWRGAFGGSIYQTSGSHGCVNLPYWAAEQIYNNIDAGVAIIIYQ